MRKPMIIAQVKNQLGTLMGGGTVEFFDARIGYRLTVMDDAVEQRGWLYPRPTWCVGGT